MIAKSDLRIVFMGTPEFAVETLRALVEGGYRVVAVVTQPDKPVGRHGSVLRAPAVKQYALSQGLPVLQPEKMKDADFLEQLASYEADLQVVVAFRMLPRQVWAMPRLGTFNVHAALLPQYRGAAPINWAIINGETRTGVTTFFLDEHIDTGRIIMRKEFDIPDDADVEYVYDGLMRLGAEVACATIDEVLLRDGDVQTISQDDMRQDAPLLPAPKIFKETCEIDWSMTAKKVYDFIRGLSPVPGAWTQVHGGEAGAQAMKVYRARKTAKACREKPGTVLVERGCLLVAAADEWVEIVELQWPGKKRMQARDFLNGARDMGSLRLGKKM